VASSGEETGGGPRRVCLCRPGPADRLRDYIPATDQVALGGRSPLPTRQASRGRHLRRSEGLCRSVPGCPRAAWTLLWCRTQAQVIRCTLSTPAEASTPPGEDGLEKGWRNRFRARRTPSHQGHVLFHHRRTGSGGLPKSNDLLVGRVNPPAGAGACRSGRPPKKPGEVHVRTNPSAVRH